MKKFKTIHNELDAKFLRQRPIQKSVKVRPGQCPSLRNIIEMASRGTAPTNIKFSAIANDGFIPPQYSREDITALHARYKSLNAERDALAQHKEVTSQDPPKEEPPKEEPPKEE